jgi:NitT/TauT family transport system substrate-binding protein
MAPPPSRAETPAVEESEVTLAVGGKGLFYYLPLTIAEQLGYFEAAGLKVRIVDFPGGAKSLQALVGGSAEFAAGSFEHVVNMRARGQHLQAIVLLARYPAIVLALKPAFAAHYRAPRANSAAADGAAGAKSA